MSDIIEPVGTYDVGNPNLGIDETNLLNYIDNQQTHTVFDGIYYSKVGNIYFIVGEYNFTSNIVEDFLPEEPVCDGFFICKSGASFIYREGSTAIEVDSTGLQQFNGFYVTNNGENRSNT